MDKDRYFHELECAATSVVDRRRSVGIRARITPSMAIDNALTGYPIRLRSAKIAVVVPGTGPCAGRSMSQLPHLARRRCRQQKAVAALRGQRRLGHGTQPTSNLIGGCEELVTCRGARSGPAGIRTRDRMAWQPSRLHHADHQTGGTWLGSAELPNGIS